MITIDKPKSIRSIICLIVFGAVLLIKTKLCLGTIYINPDYRGAELGTYTRPYNSWTDITSWTPEETYAQLCGTIASDVDLNITAPGVTITAYYSGPVLENSSPSYGPTCGNSDAKPVLMGLGKGVVISFDAGAIGGEINSISVQNGGSSSAAVRVLADDFTAKYCWKIGKSSKYGFRVGQSNDGDNAHIGYNYITSDGFGEESIDGINLGQLADYAIIEYNVLDEWGHTAISISHKGASYNEVRYNKILDRADTNNEAITPNGHHNNVHHNYIEDAGNMQIVGGHHNEYHHNIHNGISKITNDSAIWLLQPTSLSRVDVVDNKIFNNVAYDRGDSDDPVGILLYSRPKGGLCERNSIYNNILLNFNSSKPAILVSDPENLIDSTGGANGNNFRKNLIYKKGGLKGYYAIVEGLTYTHAAQLNKRSQKFSGNLEVDPGLSDPAKGDFGISSTSSRAYQAGIDTRCAMFDCDKPFVPGTDFKSSPITVVIGDAVGFGKWSIGAFGFAKK